jgi:hypothetical protein
VFFLRVQLQINILRDWKYRRMIDARIPFLGLYFTTNATDATARQGQLGA